MSESSPPEILVDRSRPYDDICSILERRALSPYDRIKLEELKNKMETLFEGYNNRFFGPHYEPADESFTVVPPINTDDLKAPESIQGINKTILNARKSVACADKLYDFIKREFDITNPESRKELRSLAENFRESHEYFSWRFSKLFVEVDKKLEEEEAIQRAATTSTTSNQISSQELKKIMARNNEVLSSIVTKKTKPKVHRTSSLTRIMQKLGFSKSRAKLEQ